MLHTWETSPCLKIQEVPTLVWLSSAAAVVKIFEACHVPFFSCSVFKLLSKNQDATNDR